MDIKKLVKPNIRSLLAYEAEEIPCRIKLDANESPYSGFRIQGSGVSSKKNFKNLNRYPDPEAKSLKKLLAKEFRVKPENILHGNGSDELIYYLITTLGGPVLYPVPTFSMYGIISQALGEKKIEIPLDETFDINTDEFYKTIKKAKPKLIFLSSPNNPTGNSFSSDRILKIIKFSSSLVVIDEAYQPFSNKKSFVPLLKKYENLIILRTLSKIGLAGLRVGFMIADSEIIKEVNKVRLPFNLNSVSQAIAVEALKKRKLLRRYIASIIIERERLFNKMNKMKSIKLYQSDANFILFKLKNSDKIYKTLLKRGVLVRNMKRIVNSCLRVTVGTPEENRIFLKTLKQLI
ncbi:MAG: histidinol-phosphate transaminase [Thermodesulfovibrionia bacterium]